MISNTLTMLEKLEERKKKLDAEIRKAKVGQARKEASIYADKCRIVGAAILLECETNETLMATIKPFIEKHTFSAKDRKSYGLVPLAKEKTDKK